MLHVSMRYLYFSSLLLSCVSILTSCLFPQSSFAMPIYIGIILCGILMSVGMYRKAAIQVKQQILMAAFGAVLTAVGVGVFFYLR
jgi:hypothetical protein